MTSERPKAVLVGVRLPGMELHEFRGSLGELARLVTTLGYDVVAEVTQQREALAAAAVIGEGKLEHLCELTGGSGKTQFVPPHKDKARLRREASLQSTDADDDQDDDQQKPKIALVAVDHELSPSQLRNLERATGSEVLDRTGVIIEIFHRHARSPKAKLEVELARLAYTAPRVRESPRGKERQQGRGAGEAAIELDRRKIRDRMAELRERIEAIQHEESVRRTHRREARRVALVGYTNAGKSSWMRALTASQVLVEDKLFATLDTTVRALAPETKPRILISDTVGFIKKLPHDLVASFKSTLDEALEASLLVYVIDAADPNWQGQLQVTRQVLTEIGAHELPSRYLLNKCDCLDEEQRKALAFELPGGLLVSSRNPDDVARVRQCLIDFFEGSYVEAELLVPYSRQRLVSEMHESGRVLSESYEDDGVRVRVLSDPETLNRLRAKLLEAE
jgi:GTP-binding protein HflX